MMPRSPSRDLSDRYIGKRGYFRNPDAFRRGRYALAVVVFLGAVGWAAVDVLNPTRAAYGHSHGPLAGPHAAFDDNCAACHVGQSLDFNPLAVFRARDRWHDLSCGKCHAGQDDIGFAHHDSGTNAAQEFHKRCSNCHHDHNGRQNSLVRLSDADCTRCHSDLGKWHEPSKSRSGTPYQNTITSFATNHPEFRALDISSKPRTLTFSHAVHMNPGQAYTPGGKEAMTLARVTELSGRAAADRYRKPGQDDNSPVLLDCASCHQLDPGAGTPTFDKLKTALDSFGEPTRALLPPRPEGAYFLPLNYEVSCRACHPLTAPEGVSAGKVVPRFNVAHRRQPTELAAELKAGYVKGMVGTNHPGARGPARARRQARRPARRRHPDNRGRGRPPRAGRRAAAPLRRGRVRQVPRGRRTGRGRHVPHRTGARSDGLVHAREVQPLRAPRHDLRHVPPRHRGGDHRAGRREQARADADPGRRVVPRLSLAGRHEGDAAGRLQGRRRRRAGGVYRLPPLPPQRHAASGPRVAGPVPERPAGPGRLAQGEVTKSGQ
ncbi:hypothetical protein FTUN_0542 [Frigoriglobus tundricola]|uniref:Uncharacterized protein n=1 Tax=Frigoriglobus tundricola TaxID=2774151 RepID=A0A6M5YJ96_9BACT|nr:hypothetical protein FTUN_0542 [Frigoriglobus tundricola]